MAVGGDVEVVDVEAGGEIGQLVLDTGIEIDEPEIFVLNLSSEDDERMSSRQENEMPGAAGEGQGGHGMRCRLGSDSFHGKLGAYVGSRVKQKASVWRPGGIDGILVQEDDGCATVYGDAIEARDAVIIRCGGDRLAVRCPGGRTL